MLIVDACETEDITEIIGFAKSKYRSLEAVGSPVTKTLLYQLDEFRQFYIKLYLPTVFPGGKIEIVELTDRGGIGVGGYCGYDRAKLGGIAVAGLDPTRDGRGIGVGGATPLLQGIGVGGNMGNNAPYGLGVGGSYHTSNGIGVGGDGGSILAQIRKGGIGVSGECDYSRSRVGGIGVGGTLTVSNIVTGYAGISVAAESIASFNLHITGRANIAVAAQSTTRTALSHIGRANISVAAHSVTSKAMNSIGTARVAVNASSLSAASYKSVGTANISVLASSITVQMLRDTGYANISTSATGISSAAIDPTITVTIDRWNVTSVDTPMVVAGDHQSAVDQLRVGSTGNIFAASNSGGAVTYSSSNTAVATIHPTTGLITMTSRSGYVAFSITVAANGNYKAKTQTGQQHYFAKIPVAVSAVGYTVTYKGSAYVFTGATTPTVPSLAASLVFIYKKSGVATSPVDVGIYEVTASVNNANYTVTGGPWYITIGQFTPVITWNLPDSITYPQALDATILNATAAGPVGNITGTWVYTQAVTGAPLGTKGLDGVLVAPVSGFVKPPVSASAFGIDVAFYPSNANYTVKNYFDGFLIVKGSQTLSWINPPPATYQFGAEYTISAATTATGLDVLITAFSGSAPFASGTNTLAIQSLDLTIGETIRFDASQAGDANWNAATTITGSTLIAGKELAVLHGSNVTTTYSGQAYGFTAHAHDTDDLSTPLNVTILYSYSQNGQPATPLNAGTYVVTATISDAHYQGSSTWTITIQKYTPNYSWNPPDITYTERLNDNILNARATGVEGLNLPGVWTYSIDGVGIIGTRNIVNLGGNGTITYPANYAGGYMPPANTGLVIVYQFVPANNNYNGLGWWEGIQVAKKDQTLIYLGSPTCEWLTWRLFQIKASSALPLTCTDASGNLNLSVTEPYISEPGVMVKAKDKSYIGTRGTVYIEQKGNENYNPTPVLTRQFWIDRARLNLVWTEPPSQIRSGETFWLLVSDDVLGVGSLSGFTFTDFEAPKPIITLTSNWAHPGLAGWMQVAGQWRIAYNSNNPYPIPPGYWVVISVDIQPQQSTLFDQSNILTKTFYITT